MDTRNDPIEFSHEDQLGRAPTAKVFAKALLASPRRPMIVAVFGPWGSGKTSFANLLSAELRAHNSCCVWFNPWQFTNPEAMTLAFFDLLATSLASASVNELAAARECFFRYAEAITSLSLMPTGSRRPGSTRFGFAKDQGFLSQPSLQEQRDTLIRLFGANPKPIVVFIDDIDRLFSAEIRLLIQLVKSNSDFPNLKFVLLFQKETVEAALKTDGQTGADFLEKIIEVPIELPLIRGSRYVSDLLREVSEIFGDLAELTAEDNDRWQRLLQRGILDNFTTLRQKNRLLDRLHLHKWSIESGLGIDINLVDLLALEILRAIDYDVYNGLRKHGPMLTEAGVEMRADRYMGDASAYLDDILTDSGNDDGERAAHILRDLFPCLRNDEDADESERDERSFRMCRSRHFPKYFFEGLLPEDMSRGARLSLESAVGRGERVFELLTAFDEHGLLFTGLDHFRTIAPTIAKEHWKAVAKDLGRVADVYGRGRDGVERSVVQHVEAGLLRMIEHGTPRERASVCAAVVSEANSLQISVLLINRGVIKDCLSERALRRHQLALAKEVSAAAQSGLLEQFEQFGRLLLNWNDWSARAASDFVRSLSSDPKRFTRFARSVAPFSSAEAGIGQRVRTVYAPSAESVLRFLPRRVAIQCAKDALAALTAERDKDFLRSLIAGLINCEAARALVRIDKVIAASEPSGNGESAADGGYRPGSDLLPPEEEDLATRQ